MIYLERNGVFRATTWTDTAECLVECVREQIFRKPFWDFDRVFGDAGEIRHTRCGYVTSDQAVVDAALDLGYWVEPSELDDGNMSILFTWSQDATNRPSKNAIHQPGRVPAEREGEKDVLCV